MELILASTCMAFFIVIVVQGVMFFALLHIIGQLQFDVERLTMRDGTAQNACRVGLGDIVADCTLRLLGGGDIRLSSRWATGRLILLFITAPCSRCLDALTEVMEYQRLSAMAPLDLVILCAGSTEQVAQLMGESGCHANIPVVVSDLSIFRRKFRVSTEPTLLFLNSTGRRAYA